MLFVWRAFFPDAVFEIPLRGPGAYVQQKTYIQSSPHFTGKKRVPREMQAHQWRGLREGKGGVHLQFCCFLYKCSTTSLSRVGCDGYCRAASELSSGKHWSDLKLIEKNKMRNKILGKKQQKQNWNFAKVFNEKDCAWEMEGWDTPWD